MRGKVRNKSAVIFIDEESLVPADAWGAEKSTTTKKGSSAGSRFHASFRKYLFSQNSVLTRLFSSLIPPFGRFQRIPVDHQGTFLSIFILFAIIYLGYVKTTRTTSRMNAFFASVFLSVGYVMGISVVIYLMSYLTKTKITFRQTVSVVGYGLFGHALALLICEFWSDTLFIPSLIVFGGLATARICFVLFARAPIAAFRFVVCTPVGVIHLLYLVYLHFAIMKDK